MLSPIFAERIDDYYRRLKESENIKGVVGFLRLLIQGNGSNQIPLIHKGNIAVRTVSTKKDGFNLYESVHDTLNDSYFLLSILFPK
jgi:hypothetical protein